MVTLNDIGTIALRYYREKYDRSQRFGQYFVNHYVPLERLPWPELFYETDNAKALDMILDYLSPPKFTPEEEAEITADLARLEAEEQRETDELAHLDFLDKEM